jgi:hypothetical protein
MGSKVDLSQLKEQEFWDYLQFQSEILDERLDTTLSKRELLAKAVARLGSQVFSLYRYVETIRGFEYFEIRRDVQTFDQMSFERFLDELPTELNRFASCLYAIRANLWIALTVRHEETQDDDFDGPDEVPPDEMAL